ncbi:MAG: S41 family peptidase, partial [Bacteroidota bacterium]
GKKGTEVNIGVKRGQQEELLEFTITRDAIPVHSVDAAMMLDEKTGFIKVNRFSATTYEEFITALKPMVEEQGMKDLVIDLRQNSGGYLTQATNMLSQLFTERGKLLVYTEGRTVKRTEYNTNGRAIYNIGEVIILIDEGSASASEILAGAIQDHDRGVLIGRRSFGKGLVQEQYPLRDESALRLTIARYYTPSGRCIQKDYSDSETDYNHDTQDRFLNGELSDENAIEIADSTRFYTSNGHVVYGGGGVTPDIFVPLDTFQLREDYLRWRQYAAGYVFRFAEQYAADLSDLTRENFNASFRLSNDRYNDFLAYGKEQGEDSAPPTNAQVKANLKRFIKARLARQLFGQEGFFQVWNEEDDMVQEALRILQTTDPLATAREEE